jgi:hypothetical protein
MKEMAIFYVRANTDDVTFIARTRSGRLDASSNTLVADKLFE